MTKKFILITSVLVGLMFSCSKAAKEAATEKITNLKVWHYFGEQDAILFEEEAKQYGNKSGINVSATFVPREDLLKQYTLGSLSQKLPDVGLVDNPDHVSFAAMGVFQDITDLVEETGEKEQFFPGPLLSATYQGRIYGLPHNSNALALFVNNTMFKEKGLVPPQNWDELVAVSEKLVDKDKGVYPLVISAIGNEEGTFQFMPWLLSAGGSIDNLASKESIRAYSFLKNMIDKGYMSPDVVNFRQGDANTQFINGLAAMQVNGPWQVPGIARDAPELDYSVVLLPKDKKYASVLGGENLAVLTGAPRKEAFDLIYFLTSKEISADYAEGTRKFPPRSDAIQLKTIWTDDPVLKIFGQELEYAMPRGPHPRWPEISNLISSALGEVLTGAKTPEEALSIAATKYDEIVQE